MALASSEVKSKRPRHRFAPRLGSRTTLALITTLSLFGAPLFQAPPASASTLGSVAGAVYTDINGNATRDPSDPGLSGRTVFADLDSNGALDPGEPSATTSGLGSYTISGITAGTYPIVTVSPAGWIVTTPARNIAVVADDTVTNVDFGSFRLGSIAGNVFEDTNGNGLKNAGESGLGALTVYIDANTNGVRDVADPTATTDVNGSYSFSSLTAGSYVVRMVLPSGTSQTNADPATIIVSSGTAPTTVDFGIFARGSISGTVFRDLNGNGTRDVGETGYAGADVFFDLDTDGLLDVGETSTTTDGAGAYTFNSMGAGTYQVTVALPATFGSTSANPVPEVITSGTYVSNLNFGISDTGIMSGNVFEDIDADGTRDAGEPASVGRTVFLDSDNDGAADVGEVTATTDSSGNFFIAGLAPGSYRPRIVVPAGTSQTTVSPTTVTVAPSVPVTGVAFGLFTQGTITGNVYIDTDGNGSSDVGELGTAAKTVFLDLNNNGSPGSGEPTTTTDSSGNYAFTGLASGTYRPKVVVAAGSQLTSTLPTPITITSGTSVANINFGLFTQGSISGLVFNDLNGNGTREVGEAVLSGRTVFLDSNNNALADVGEPTATTATTGIFTFSALGPGGFRVRIVPPANTIRTSPLLATVTMTSGLTSTGNDVALFTLGSISGTIFNDTDGNGSKGTSETGLVGRTVYLDADADDALDVGEVTAVTGASGVYNFTGLTVGSYTVRLIEPAGQTQTTANPAATNVISGTAASISLGLYLDSNITGTVYDDQNGSASITAGEPGISGVVVYLDVNNNSVLDVGEQNTTTNSSGLYGLANIGPGANRVRMVVPSGRAQTTTNPGLVSPPSGGTTANINFGLFSHASITGVVFNDINGNGTIGTGENTISGRTIYVDNNANNTFDVGELSAVTDVTGSYSFTGLTWNTYRLKIVVPSGFNQSGTNPAAIVPVSGGTTSNVNFGLFGHASITGTVFTDVNGNGSIDAGEAGVSGKTLFLDTNTNGTLNVGEPTTLSDSVGNYAFTGLGLGSYRVRVSVPGDSVQTTTTPAAVSTTSSLVASGNNFGLFVKASITGTVYNDVAGNGSKDPGDGGVGSRTVFIDLDGDGSLDTGEPNTTTNAAGTYTLTGLSPGSYTVRAQLPAGTIQTAGPSGPVVPQSGSTTTGVDFGQFPLGTISGTVYNDVNGNGTKNSGDVGVAGRIVFLDTDNNGTFDTGEASVTTSTSGTYSFTGLNAGTYHPRLVVPSNGIQSSTTPAPVVTVSGTIAGGNDFGIYTYSSIGGTVFEDANGNGSKGTGENGRAGATVYIDSNVNLAFDAGEPTAITDSNGMFLFSNLLVGTYRVRPLLPVFTAWTSTVLPAVSTTSNSTSPSNAIGLFTQGKISGTVYTDNNANEVMDPDELGVAGRTVFLDTNGNGTVTAGEVSVTTDVDGKYTFTGLNVGSYKPRTVTPSGSIQTTASPAAISVVSSTNAADVNFGSFTGGTISGTVFTDTNSNGTREGGESASAGRTVFLDADNDGIKDAAEVSVLSNPSGVYTFTTLAGGTYRPRMIAPSGMTITSDVPAPVVIVSGTVANGIDFGLRSGTSTPTTTPPTTTPPSPGNPTPTTPESGRTDAMSVNSGYWMTSTEGGVFAYGGAKFFGSAVPFKPLSPIVALAPTSSNNGYYQVATDGGIFAFGDAKFFGSMGGKALNKPIVGMATTPSGNGYWLVATDGGIFAYGDAAFYGSTGGIKLNQPIVGMATTASGKGYWLVASDGGIFAYGDAKFFGSTGSIRLNQPIVGMAASGDSGYWLVASDGGIFAFGSARFYGSMGGTKLNEPIASIRAPADGGGYWMFARDGGVFAFGSAKFYGGTPKTSSPIIN